jgi:hypothetical protein
MEPTLEMFLFFGGVYGGTILLTLEYCSLVVLFFKKFKVCTYNITWIGAKKIANIINMNQ